MKKNDSLEEIMKNVDWTRWMQVIIPIMQPVLIFGGWLAFAKFNKRADALSKLIAIAEPIPAVDLNLPQPVVLASLYHSTEDALAILNDIIKFLKDLEVPSADEIIKDIKEELKETAGEIIGEGIEDKQSFLNDYSICKRDAKITLGFLYNKYTGFPLIAGCMVKKGYTRALVEEAIRQKLGI